MVETMSPGIETFVRCFLCFDTTTVRGNTWAFSSDTPGWRISRKDLYRPSGEHFCPRHARSR